MFFSLRPNPLYLPPLPNPTFPLVTSSPSYNTRQPELVQGEFLTFPLLFYFQLTQEVNQNKNVLKSFKVHTISILGILYWYQMYNYKMKNIGKRSLKRILCTTMVERGKYNLTD